MRADWQCYRLDLRLCVSVCALHHNQPWLSEITAGTQCPWSCGVFLSALETQMSLETPLKVASIAALKTCTPAKSPMQGLCCTHRSHPWRRLFSHWMDPTVCGNTPWKINLSGYCTDGERMKMNFSFQVTLFSLFDWLAGFNTVNWGIACHAFMLSLSGMKQEHNLWGYSHLSLWGISFN